MVDAVHEYYQPIEVDLQADYDRQKSEEVRRKSMFDKYYELRHQLVPKDIFIIRSIYIEPGAELTCPAKTIAIFAHYEDINYAQLPELVTNINGCTTIEQVRHQ